MCNAIRSVLTVDGRAFIVDRLERILAENRRCGIRPALEAFVEELKDAPIGRPASTLKGESGEAVRG